MQHTINQILHELESYSNPTKKEQVSRFFKTGQGEYGEVAIVATLALIRKGEWKDTVALAERLLTHPHDLIHKAVGWMLREMGKQNKEVLIQFLEKHGQTMPRTMLRYAIEQLSPKERTYFMKR